MKPKQLEAKLEQAYHDSQMMDIGFSEGVMYAMAWCQWLYRDGEKPNESSARRNDKYRLYKHYQRVWDRTK